MTEAVLLRRMQNRWLFAGVGAALVALGLWLLLPRVAVRGYLAAFLFWCGAPLGGAAILMLHFLVGGRWGPPLRPALGAALRTLPLFVILFLPIAFALSSLYPWIDAGARAASETMSHRAAYLNPAFFLVRAFVFLGVWSVGGVLLSAKSWQARQSIAPGVATWAAVGLIVYFLTASFAAYDWMASLVPEWYSSVLGMYVIIGQCLTALSLLIIVTTRFLPDPNADEHVRGILHDLGNLLLVGVVLHAYLAYSQFFIAWNGNLSNEVSWYVPRTHGAWGWVSLLLIVVHFVLPFAALLSRRTKRSRRALAGVAWLILAAQAIEAVWMVTPTLDDSNLAAILPAGVSIVAVGGLWLAASAATLRRRIEQEAGA